MKKIFYFLFKIWLILFSICLIVYILFFNSPEDALKKYSLSDAIYSTRCKKMIQKKYQSSKKI